MKVLYNSFSGRFSDSPKSLYFELLRQFPNAQHVWLFDELWESEFPRGVDRQVFDSRGGLAALEEADIIVSNTYILGSWRKKRGATYLQTWHGAPFKKVHLSMDGYDRNKLAGLIEDRARWDVLLAPSNYAAGVFREAFDFPGPILIFGLPRNDQLFVTSNNDEFRAALGIQDGSRVVLYAPTYRDSAQKNSAGRRLEVRHLDLDQVARSLGEDVIVLNRSHHTTDPVAYPHSSRVRDISGMPDITDVFHVTDVLVTDYSSSMFDFALTRKPMVLFPYDIETYLSRDRGLYLDYASTVPGRIVYNEPDLIDAIGGALTNSQPGRRYLDFWQRYCRDQCPDSAARVVDTLMQLH